jgi:hypothetical protein
LSISICKYFQSCRFCIRSVAKDTTDSVKTKETQTGQNKVNIMALVLGEEYMVCAGPIPVVHVVATRFPRGWPTDSILAVSHKFDTVVVSAKPLLCCLLLQSPLIPHYHLKGKRRKRLAKQSSRNPCKSTLPANFTRI